MTLKGEINLKKIPIDDPIPQKKHFKLENPLNPERSACEKKLFQQSLPNPTIISEA
jgi:hypothetical protein